MADFGFIPNLIAGGDIYPYRFVELSTASAFTGVQANAASDNIVGVTDGSTYAFNVGLNAAVVTVNGVSTPTQISLQPTNTVQVEAGAGGVTIGCYLTSDANGKALKTTTAGQVAYYIALEAANAGEIFRAFRIGPRTL